ncbi:MAG: HpcH/HpaI aldolase/citrate lyase family protein [Lysobacterales bacterium]
MQSPMNGLKLALGEGRSQTGLWMALADPYAAELCAGSGFDWLAIDAEHAPNDLRSILATLQALAAYPVHPVVRLPHHSPALIKQVLELGARNLMLPMVESAEQARELVRATRYPPEGIRGMGSALGRSSRWNRYSDYLQTANGEVCLIVQVESHQVLPHIDEIAAVEGVDCVFIGPADLAASMGYRTEPDHPEVREAVAHAIATIARSGKAPGVLCTDEPLAHQYLEGGAQLIAVGVDTGLLVQAADRLAGKFRGA